MLRDMAARWNLQQAAERAAAAGANGPCRWPPEGHPDILVPDAKAAGWTVEESDKQ
jgi:hypothetical protein